MSSAPITATTATVSDEAANTLRVVVTRPAPQAEKLAQAVEQAGYLAIRFPLLEISPVVDAEPLHQALGQLRRFALVVFVSPNAIGQTLRHMMQRGQRWPTEVPIAVLGPGSAESLAEHGIAPPQFRVIQPGAQSAASGNAENTQTNPRYDSEALLAELARQGFDAAGLAGKAVLLVRGNGGRELLGEQLRAAGAELTVVEAYQRHLSRPTPQAWQGVRSSLGQPHAWLLTSSEAVRNLAILSQAHLTPEEQTQLLAATVITPHPRIAETAQKFGFTHVRLSGSGDSQLLKAVRAWGNEQKASVGAQPTRAGGWQQVAKSGALWPLAILAGVLVLGGVGVGGYKYIAHQQQRATQATVVAAGEQDYAALQGQIKALEARLQETQVQQSQFAQRVQALNPDVASSRERWTLMEAEQMLSATAQQLQLTGNVGQALVALQTIDTRLALANQAQWIPLRRALAKDIDRLKALPQLDITGAAIKLDEAIAQVDAMPMWADGNVTKAATVASAAVVPPKAKAGQKPQVASAALPSEGSLWQRWLDMALREARQLVQIRRVDDAQVLLASPEQAWFLRESLKLRLLNARLALLSRQEGTFKSDVTQAQTLVKKHFDPQAPATQTVQALLQQVQQAAGAINLPNLSESLAAVRAQAH